VKGIRLAIFFFVLVAGVGSLGHAADNGVRVEATTNRMIYQAGKDVLVPSASVVNPGEALTVDVHAGFVSPTGTTFYEWPDWNTTFTPPLAGFTLPPGEMPATELFSVPVETGAVPFEGPGTYLFFVALTEPGTMNLAADLGFAPFLVTGEELRSTKTYTVPPARSLNNVFGGIVLPRNPGMAENDRSGGHQDSYCSDSVGLSGPVSGELRVIKQFNPYGFIPIMACNSGNQMTGVALSYEDATYRLVVFDKDLRILSATETADFVPASFGGGYFFMDKDDNSVVVGENRMKCFPTANVEARDEVYELEPLWVSDDIVRLVTQSDAPNSLYATLPLWDAGRPNTYWCLLAGHYDVNTGVLGSPAYIALVEIVPDPSQPGGCTTRLIDRMELSRQWNNNTFAVDEDGAYFVTNGLDERGACNQGLLHAVSFDEESSSIVSRWTAPYRNSGLLKTGSKNIGSGTTPTILQDEAGHKMVAIADNDNPRINVLVVSHADGSPVAEVPVFSPMRGTAEASLIGVNRSIVVENNFGHTTNIPESQWVENEPGLSLVEIDPPYPYSSARVVWESDRTSFFAMSMLARESGIVFAHTGDWSDAVSATEGGMYFVSALDSWDGRVVWRIPLGRGWEYCHEFGGIYFNREGSLYVGTNAYLFSIQEVAE